jgi:hypothetical protein
MSSELLPTRARARAEGVTLLRPGWIGRRDVLARAPRSEAHELAIVVHARAQRRGTADEEHTLTATQVRTLHAARDAPEPTEAWSSWTRQELLAVRDRKGVACSHCTVTPGRSWCSRCYGRRFVDENGDGVGPPCPSCNGEGTLVCPACEGTKVVFPSVVRRTTVSVSTLSHVFAPLVPSPLHHELAARILADTPIDARLAIDLDRLAAGPLPGYRGPAKAGPLRIHGIDAAVPIAEARAAVARLGQDDVVAREVRAHAVPVTILRYPKGFVALLAERGPVHAIGAWDD